MAMAEASMPKTLPGGGLASFLTSNLDEIDDSVLAFGAPSGINSIRDVAERMAQMGRNGDNFIVHASEREMLVPREVVEKNPELRQQIMQSIAAEGADPNAYIVGNEANSINPITGQREFFIRKLVRGVKNIFKKVAPIVLPVVGSMVLGPIWGAAAGSALNAAIQGGNVRDVLRAGLIGGVAGGVFSGVSGAIQGVQAGIGALPGARAALTAAISPGNVFGNLGSRIAERGFFNAYQGPDFAAMAAPTTAAAPAAAAPAAAGVPAAGAAVPTPAAASPAQPSFMDRIFGRTAQPSVSDIAAQASEIAAAQGLDPNVVFETLSTQAAANQPGVIQRFGPMLAGGLALGAATGAFNAPEQEPIPTPGYDGPSSAERLASNPELYSVGVPQEPVYASYGDVALPASYSSVVPQLPPVRVQPIELEPIRFAAAGGEMASFPRRIGAISGPGTETSDDVPAMLSDGEFVMTARAVRGAGNGDRERGVRRMYDMMRMFEGGVAR